MKNPKEKRIMMKWRAWGTLLVLAIGVPAAALAQGVIQSITSTQQAGSEVVRVELSEALAAVPAGFAVQAPPRIAIDLPGVGNALGRTSVELNQGNLRSINVAQAGERTRLVLNLKLAATYRAQLDGKALLIIVDSAGTAPTTTAAAPAVSSSACRPARSGWTFASRVPVWWSSSCARRCPTACAVAWA